MIRLRIIFAIAFVLLGSELALAAQPTPVPNTPPDFSLFNFEIGTWHCHETLAGRPGDRTETDTYTLSYDGWQLQAHSFPLRLISIVPGMSWATPGQRTTRGLGSG